MKRTHTMGALLVVVTALGSWAANAAGTGLTWLDEPVQGAFDVTGAIAVKDAGGLHAALVFDSQANTPGSDHYTLSLGPRGAQFSVLRKGNASAIGLSTAVALKPTKEPVTFTLQRRDWGMAFILGNQVIARAFDPGLTGGKVGYSGVGAEWSDVRVQQIGDILLRDDFVRDVGVQSAWENVSGTWEQQTLREDPQASRMEADKSANAFSYFGRAAKGRGIAVAGYWFWSDYSFKVAVRPEGDSAVGIVFYYQDDKNYLALRWLPRDSTAKDGDRIQLIQVLGGQEKVLVSKPGGYVDNHWCSLRVNACGDIVQCFVDDELTLQAHVDTLGQGQIGFLVDGPKGAFFDDAEALDWEVFSDDLSTLCPGKWAALSGAWQFGKDAVARATGGGEAVSVTGREAWKNYAYAADTKGNAGQGIAFCATPGSSYVFRWAPKDARSPYAGKAQLLRIAGADRKVLAEGNVAAGGADWHRTKVEVEDGFIVGSVDGTPVLRTFDAGAGNGRIGLYADGGAAFRRAYVALIPPKTSAHVVKEFTDTSQHPEMAEWASTRAPWVKPAETGESAVWWTKGDYYGDQSMHFAIPSPGSHAGTLTAVLGADPTIKDSGYLLSITATSGSKALAVTVASRGKELGKAQVTTVGDPCPVVYERRNGVTVVEIDGKVVLTCK